MQRDSEAKERRDEKEMMEVTKEKRWKRSRTKDDASLADQRSEDVG